METKNLLVHMSPSVIKAMAAFVYLAIIKDALVGLVSYGWYGSNYDDQGMDLFTSTKT